MLLASRPGTAFLHPTFQPPTDSRWSCFTEDGRVEYESPHVRGKAAALRLDSLLDRLAEERYEPVREVLVKMLALSVWREHPDVKKVRATFGAVHPPGIDDFEQGKQKHFNQCSASISVCGMTKSSSVIDHYFVIPPLQTH